MNSEDRSRKNSVGQPRIEGHAQAADAMLILTHHLSDIIPDDSEMLGKYFILPAMICAVIEHSQNCNSRPVPYNVLKQLMAVLFMLGYTAASKPEDIEALYDKLRAKFGAVTDADYDKAVKEEEEEKITFTLDELIKRVKSRIQMTDNIKPPENPEAN